MAKFSRKRIAQHLATCDTAQGTTAKGQALEALSVFLFGAISGVALHERNVLDGPRAHELDAVFWNDQRRSPIHFLDAILVVECKNTGTAVGSRDVRWFIDKLRDRSLSTGILVALSGITGDPKTGTSAYSEVYNALPRDGVRLLVLAREEVASLTSTADLVELLKTRLLELTLFRTTV